MTGLPSQPPAGKAEMETKGLKRSQQRFNNFQKALKLYQEAVASKMTRLEEEGLIHRFEFTFELAWKTLQDLLQERGYDLVRGPRPVIEQAFQDGIITNGRLWLDMIRARNETTHLYDEAVFLSIIEKVRGPFLDLFEGFSKNFPKP